MIKRSEEKKDKKERERMSREKGTSEENNNKRIKEERKGEKDVTENSKEYVAIAKEGNYDVRSVNKLLAMDENLPGLAAQRAVVQWAFNEDTDLGAIKRFNVNNGYAIVQLTARYRSGTMTVADASDGSGFKSAKGASTTVPKFWITVFTRVCPNRLMQTPSANR